MKDNPNGGPQGPQILAAGGRYDFEVTNEREAPTDPSATLYEARVLNGPEAGKRVTWTCPMGYFSAGARFSARVEHVEHVENDAFGRFRRRVLTYDLTAYDGVRGPQPARRAKSFRDRRRALQAAVGQGGGEADAHGAGVRS